MTQVKLVGGGVAFIQFKNVDMKQEALTYDLRFMSSKFVHGKANSFKLILKIAKRRSELSVISRA